MQIKKKSKTAIMGFGNPCRSDDGIGIYVVDELKNTWPIDDENVSILDMGTGAFEVLFKTFLEGSSKKINNNIINYQNIYVCV